LNVIPIAEEELSYLGSCESLLGLGKSEFFVGLVVNGDGHNERGRRCSSCECGRGKRHP